MGRVLLRGVGDLALTLGALTLLFVLWQVWWSDVQANAQSRQELEHVYAELAAADDGEQAGGQVPRQDDDGGRSEEGEVVEPASSTYGYDEPIGVIHLPTLGEERVVKEGTDGQVINQGVLGHYPTTAAPGEVGNFAVAGHRTTYGRPLWDLGEMETGDPIVVETSSGYHIYRLDRLEVVEPSRWQVLAPVPGDPEATPDEAAMVLTACHPKFSAEERLIAYATLDRSVPRGDGPPAELRALDRSGRS